MNLPSKTMSISDACKRTGVGRSTIYRLLHAGRLDAVKIRGRTLIVTKSLDKLIANSPPFYPKGQ